MLVQKKRNRLERRIEELRVPLIVQGEEMKKAIFVQGLAYGDEAKGATVDFLCRQLPVDLVVRYNGGSQAAHNVVTPEGVHHTFSQFGSGTLAHYRVRTHLSRFMLVNPLNMMKEAEALSPKVHGNIWARTTVDPRCVVITPFHRQVNRLREEARGDKRHGSCGQGVGVAREWNLKYNDNVLLAGDLLSYDKMLRKLRFLCDVAANEFGWVSVQDIDMLDLAGDYRRWAELVTFSETLPTSELAVFEGAQGVLLDETHGEAPHNTWTDCTFANADTLCAEAGIAERFRIGCLRAYLTRHGAGPLDGELSCALDVPTEHHNGTNEWQGHFRKAAMDFGLLLKAIGHIGRLDCIALSHLDVLTTDASLAKAEVASVLGVPVGIVANGPTASHRTFMPAWTTAWLRLTEPRS